MPHILPIEQMKDFEEIARLCNESEEPVFLTKDGAGAYAVLDMESYEKLLNKKCNKSVEEMDGVDVLLSLQQEMDK